MRTLLKQYSDSSELLLFREECLQLPNKIGWPIKRDRMKMPASADFVGRWTAPPDLRNRLPWRLWTKGFASGTPWPFMPLPWPCLNLFARNSCWRLWIHRCSSIGTSSVVGVFRHLVYGLHRNDGLLYINWDVYALVSGRHRLEWYVRTVCRESIDSTNLHEGLFDRERLEFRTS